MRRVATTLLLLLTACEMTPQATVVDPSRLPPLTGREQSLLIGGDAALQQGNLEVAEKDYLSAVSASTGHVEAHLALAKMYLAANRAEPAREVLERARGFQPTHPQVNYLLGKIALGQGNPDGARNAFVRGLEREPGNTDLLNGAGIADDMLGRHNEAQSMYLRALQEKGVDLSGVRSNLAMSYLLINQPQRAVDLLKAEAKKPHAPAVVRHNLALAYGLMGEHIAAKKVLNHEVREEVRRAGIAKLKAYIDNPAPDKRPTELLGPVKPQA